jgi:hypothetical protein
MMRSGLDFGMLKGARGGVKAGAGGRRLKPPLRLQRPTLNFQLSTFKETLTLPSPGVPGEGIEGCIL